eukprot:9119272-Heterocapsa_arctica.AAC.1
MEAFERVKKDWKWCLPQVEANRNHTNGTRIGDARKPGQNGNGQPPEKTWTGITANITSWNSSG